MALADKAKREKQGKDTVILTVAQTDELIEEYHCNTEQCMKESDQILSIIEECKERIRRGKQ